MSSVVRAIKVVWIADTFVIMLTIAKMDQTNLIAQRRYAEGSNALQEAAYRTLNAVTVFGTAETALTNCSALTLNHPRPSNNALLTNGHATTAGASPLAYVVTSDETATTEPMRLSVFPLSRLSPLPLYAVHVTSHAPVANV
jgi:hypothetical protein